MKTLHLLIVGVLAITQAYAGEPANTVSEKISVADAESYIKSGEGGERPYEIAVAALKGERLDLVDFFLKSNRDALSYLFDELRKSPDSEFKEQVVIRTLRARSGWGSDNSWASTGVIDPIQEPYFSVLKKRLPGIPPGPNLLATAAAREKLANDLEAAIKLDSSATRDRPQKPRLKPEEMAFTATNPAPPRKEDPSPGEGRVSHVVAQSRWMYYLCLAIAAVGGGAICAFLKKRHVQKTLRGKTSGAVQNADIDPRI